MEQHNRTPSTRLQKMLTDPVGEDRMVLDLSHQPFPMTMSPG
jgi:hypothetical protein